VKYDSSSFGLGTVPGLFYSLNTCNNLIFLDINNCHYVFLDSPHKIFIGGLPAYLNDEQVSHFSSKISSPLFLA